MNSLLFIIDLPGNYFFDLFYILAFLLGFVWLLVEGHRRKYHFVAWLLALACSRFLFIAGTKLFTYSDAEWQALVTDFYLPATNDKLLFGGLLLSMAVYWPLKKLLSLKNDALDAFAIMLPIGIGVQRFGCWLAGCCHGKITMLPWGMQYKPYTLPHFHQFEARLLPDGQYYSLPVHPTQLYEVVASVAVAGLLLFFRKRLKVAGNLFMLSILLYSFFRFFIEFFRDAAAHAAGGTPLGGLKVVQWIILVMILVLGAVVMYRERKFSKVQAPVQTGPAPDLFTTLVLLLALVLASWSLRNWFTYAELVALHISILPAIAMAGVHIFRTVTVPRYRWLTAGILVVPLLLMSQTFPTEEQNDSAQVKTYHSFKVGYGSGDYYNSHDIGTGSGCSRVSNTRYFHQEYKVGGAGYAITKEKEKETLTYGVNVYGGSHQETDITHAPVFRTANDLTLFGVNPYILYDQKWAGIGGGLHLGNLFYTTENLQKEGSGIPQSGGRKVAVYPQLYVRFGATRLLFAEYRLADQFPSGLPGLRHQVSLGSGFGIRNGSYLRGGSTGPDSYVAGHFVLGQQFVLEPLYLWGVSTVPFATGTVDYKQRQFLLGLHYRFNFKEEKVPGR
ncbi:prolipoprotein diacylglyceryl transferase [Botryobacter ruber]|uniref:prolipoprotein diacylglyceryl transferase n=1 Tax=Botryobacter ruber TaxID=2171629 RepID=UPI000E0C72FC|nr:prolipoprotein diacylglyceryl transferase family protein [Botryobacter ruber]